MEIVFIGTPDFALPSLSLLNKHHNIPLVITQKDKPKGRGKKLFSPPVKQFSQKLNLEFIQPNSIKNDSVIKILKSIAPDIFVLDQDSGKAKVVSQPKEIDNQIKMAIESCPVKAIKIERKEDESKK